MSKDTLLKDALSRLDLSDVKRAVEMGADVNQRLDNKETPLMLAVFNTDILRYLITKGADVNAVDSNGYTALHYATDYDIEESARILLDAGALSTIKNKQGQFAANLNPNLSNVFANKRNVYGNNMNTSIYNNMKGGAKAFQYHSQQTISTPTGSRQNIVQIRNGKGTKMVVERAPSGKVLHKSRKNLKPAEINHIRNNRFIPGLFKSCTRKNRQSK